LRWPGSPKTIEGTFAFILSQVIIAALLNELSFGVIVAIVIVGLVEARTDQVDNLVLPMLMFSIVTFLS
jgi:dolichol kinase